MRQLLITYLLFSLLCIFSGCINKAVIHSSYQPVPTTGWDRNNTLEFNIYIPDSNVSYKTFLLVRTLDSYPYQDLSIAIEYSNDSLPSQTDTLNISLTDERKTKLTKWAGLKQAVLPLIEEKRINHPDTFRFRISSLMDDQYLQGINDIAILMER